ncbi:MAG: sugar phosphate isomerase/epimerase [Candidatus Symbiothrix sp.]|jgi:sugar phosphate isomerase/epimerase|nr:sugar phosphate isomerase/epimerase [Candidatus Symbiothrix sp.]
MNRRDFINKGIAAVTCVGLNNSLFSAIAANGADVASFKKNNRIGIQLYCIREFLPKDYIGSLQKLADIGYSHVEAWGFNGDTFYGKTLKETSDIVKDMGMKLNSTLCGSEMLPADTKTKEWDYWRKTIQAMKDAGGNQLIQGFLPAAGKTLDELKRSAEQFNRIGEICKKDGIFFGYHNHHEEFSQIEGQVILDVLLQNTDPGLVFFQLDLGHAVNGGGDILNYFRKYPKRFRSWHASDFKKGVGYVELGQGDVPYDELFKVVKSSGLKDLTMEHENGEDRFAIMKRNFDYLTKYQWTKHK